MGFLSSAPENSPELAMAITLYFDNNSCIWTVVDAAIIQTSSFHQ